MTTIPPKELRNNLSDVLRRAEAGQEFTITVAGRPVATLGPTSNRRWVGGVDLERVFKTQAPTTLWEDLERISAGLADPFA
jgi:prevent-host-death family protein